jgi:surface carbohydrate biosynthesis protein (TIGR04326 family)
MWIFLFLRLFVVRRFQERFEYRNVDLGFLLFSDFKSLCFGHGARLLFLRGLFQKAFERLSARAVLYRKEFNSIGRIVASAAVEGCKMMSAQHGIINNSQIGYLYRPNEIDHRRACDADHVQHCPVPDCVLVFGTRMVEYMAGAGFPKDRICAVGSLRHDAVVRHYLNREENRKNAALLKECRRALEIKEGRFVLLLCTQWQEVACDWFDMIVQAIRQSKIQCTFIVKPHPHYPKTEEMIEKRFEDSGLTDVRITNSDVYKLAFCSDVVVTHSSTAILDAILLGTPVILIRQEGLPNDNTLFTRAQVGESVGTPAEMARAMVQLQSGEFDRKKWETQRVAFLRYHLHNRDGGATQRLVSLLA